MGALQVMSAMWDEAVDALGDHLGLYMVIKKQQQQQNAEQDAALGHGTVSVRKAKVPYHQLTQGRIIGTGQFGAVRIVQHKGTGETFALKVRPPPEPCGIIASVSAQSALFRRQRGF